MNNNNIRVLACLALALLVSACASQNLVLAPDTMSGDQLKPEYMVGKWCTNRDLTSQTNKDAGQSALSNLSQEFWRFNEGGKWENAESGWIYTNYGKWQLEGLNTMVLERLKGKPKSYQANFKNEGADFYLEDEDGKFLVLSRCE